MEFLCLRKSKVPVKTTHYIVNLDHLVGSDDVPLPYVLIQLYSEEQTKVCRDWFYHFYDRAKASDGETDVRRVLNYMINICESDRMRFDIVDGVLSTKLKDGSIITDMAAAINLCEMDLQ